MSGAINDFNPGGPELVYVKHLPEQGSNRNEYPKQQIRRPGLRILVSDHESA
jgi:hypothetical protein